MWRLEWDLNLRPSGRKALNLSLSHHAPKFVYYKLKKLLLFIIIIMFFMYGRLTVLKFMDITVSVECCRMLCSSERGVIQIISKAADHLPCVIVIESLDLLCSNYKPLPKGSEWKYTDAIILAMEKLVGMSSYL